MSNWYRKECANGGESTAEEEEMVKSKILLRAIHSAAKDKSSIDICYSSYSDFQILDLESGKFSKVGYTLLGDFGIGSIVSLGSVIYTIGKPKTQARPPDYTEYYTYLKAENDVVAVHEGLSFFDMAGNPFDEWNKGPIVKHDQHFPNCVPLFGKVFVVYKRITTTTDDNADFDDNADINDTSTCCFGEVYDPKVNSWQPLLLKPPPESRLGEFNYKVSTPIVSDPLHGRIIVNIDFTKPFQSSIYAYYPADDSWECLVDNFNGNWKSPLALVDGVIYLYAIKSRQLVDAYDLRTKQWLDVVLASEFDKDYSRCYFKALHHLGHGLMCFTTYYFCLQNLDPTVVNDHTALLSVQFKVHCCDNKVFVTPVSSRSFPMESYCTVYGQIAI